jgi:hypothetical protein
MAYSRRLSLSADGSAGRGARASVIAVIWLVIGLAGFLSAVLPGW